MRPLVGSSVGHGIGMLVAMGWDRLTLGLAVIIAVTVLVIDGRVEGVAAVGIFSAIAGYVVGAGHESAKRETIE